MIATVPMDLLGLVGFGDLSHRLGLLIHVLLCLMTASASITIAFGDILQSSHDIIGERSDKVADVLESRRQILCHWRDLLGNHIS